MNLFFQTWDKNQTNNLIQDIIHPPPPPPPPLPPLPPPPQQQHDILSNIKTDTSFSDIFTPKNQPREAANATAVWIVVVGIRNSTTRDTSG
jgi:hypothetical protein